MAAGLSGIHRAQSRPVAAGLDGSGPPCPALVFLSFLYPPEGAAGAARGVARLLPSTLVRGKLRDPPHDAPASASTRSPSSVTSMTRSVPSVRAT